MPDPDRTAEAIDDLLDPATGAVERADVALAMKAARLRDVPAIRALGTLSEVADQPPAYAVSGAALALGLLAGRPRLAEAGARMLLSVTLAIAAKSAVKAVVARTRPNKVLDEGHYEVKAMGPNEGPWNSFPSGHTADAVAMARAIARVAPEAAMPAYGAAVVIAGVQVPRGAHYPVDVAAGALVGWGAEAAADWAWTRARPVVAEVLPEARWPGSER